VEVLCDLGLAFAAVLVLIYVLVVGWFRSFVTPLVIMALIPLTLVGILPAHALMGAFFTASSMSGFIAGAGIIVRNSIILVDFIELRRAQGKSLEDAVVDAGAVRFRPMLLTAAAVVVGASVILFDPIFPGLGPVVDGRRDCVHRSVSDGSSGPLLPLAERALASTRGSPFAGKCRMIRNSAEQSIVQKGKLS
jgi:multidrug efflux pump subunit AcrB